MAAPTSSSTFPTSGTYPVTLAADLFDSKKRKANDGELFALRYAFKPVSMSSFSEASITSADAMGSKVLRATTSSHGEQAFDIREEQSKSRECVLVYDEVKHTFTLHPLPSVVHLTLNRTPQSTFSRPGTSHSESSASSMSVPLAQRTWEEDQDSRSSGESGRHEVSSALGAGGDTPRIKRARPSETVRPTRGGKGLPRKALPAHAPIPTPTPTKGKGRGKANPKKATTAKKGAKAKIKAPPVPAGKLSAEIIEDSDEEYGLEEVGGGGDEEDELAKMVGESLAQEGEEDEEDDDDDDDDDDEEDEDDDEDEELGGARLVVRQQGASNLALADGESEWL